MKTLLLVLLIAWPWSNPRAGKVTLDTSGHAIVVFRKPFPPDTAPGKIQCTVTGAKLRAWSYRGIDLVGGPGEQASYSCKLP